MAILGRYEEAITHYREAIKRNANSPMAMNNLAWIYATQPREGLRNASDNHR